MKKTTLLAATAALVCATPAFAQDHGGYAGLRYSTGELDQGPTSDIDAWQGEAEVGFTHGAWGGQFGGSFGNADVSTSNDTDFFTLNAHLNWGGENWRVGGFVVYGSIDEINVDEWTYGAEAAFDIGPNATIFGTGALGNLDGPTDSDIWNFDAAFAYYFTDNFRLSGNVGTGNIDDFDYDTTTYGINGEVQPFSVPISFTFGWNAISIDGSGFDADGDYLSVGARWNFGAGTLRDRNSVTPFNQPTAYAQRVYGATLY